MVNHSAREHAPFGGSGAHAWLRCHGRNNLLKTLPPHRRIELYADEGTFAHEVLDDCLKNNRDPSGRFTPEIERSVSTVLEYVADLRKTHSDLYIKSEYAIRFPQTVVPPNDCAGIVDILCYSSAIQRVWIVDFKHGVQPVNVENNEQLLFYATAACWDMKLTGITLVIVQPNTLAGPIIQEWEISPAELVDYAVDVDTALRLATQPTAPLVPGDHCRWCAAEPVCLAREELALREMTGAATVMDVPSNLPPPANLSPERLARIKFLEPQLKAWLAAVNKYAYERAIHGEIIPNHKLVVSSNDRKFTGYPADIADELIMLSGYGLELDDVYPRQLIGITEAEKKLKAAATAMAPLGKKRAAVEETMREFAFLTTKTPSEKYSLVPDTDRRPAANPLEKMFGNVVIIPVEPMEAAT